MKNAIIGTGIAGNVAAYKLRQQHDITVFEAGSFVESAFVERAIGDVQMLIMRPGARCEHVRY